MALYVAATVTNGNPWPDDPVPSPRGSVLYLTDENSPGKTLMPRFLAMECQAEKIRFHIRSYRTTDAGNEQDVPLVFTEHERAIEEQMKLLGDVKLVVIDPLAAYVHPKRNINDLSDMTAEMGQFRAFAERHNIAMILVAHLNEKFDSPDVHRVAGSTAIMYRSRAGHIVRMDPSDETEERRQMLCTKVFDGQRPHGLVFTIESGTRRLIFAQGTLTNYGQSGGGDSTSRPPSPKVQAAIDFLHDQLSRSPLERQLLFERATEAGIKEWALKEAVGRAGIVTQSVGFGADKTAMWGLPGQDFSLLLGKYGKGK